MSRIPAEVPDAKVVLDGDPLEALAHIARADVLVAARSQFSYAAIALSQGVVVYPSKWHAHRQSVPRFAAERVAKCHVPASDSGNIDRDRQAAALRACRVVGSKTMCLDGSRGRRRGADGGDGSWRSVRVGSGRGDLLGDDDLAELDGRRWSPLCLPQAHRRGADQNAGGEHTSDRQTSTVDQTAPRELDDDDDELRLRVVVVRFFLGAVGVPVLGVVVEAPEGHVVVVFSSFPALLHSQTNVTVRALEDRVFRALARRHALLRADVVGLLATDLFARGPAVEPDAVARARLARLVIAPVACQAAAPFISLAGDRAGLEARLSDTRARLTD